MGTIFGEVRREVANTLYEQEKRYLEEKRGLEAKIDDLETTIRRLEGQLAEEKAGNTYYFNPTALTGAYIHIKPQLGRPYYITYKGKEYVKVDRAPKEGDVINVTSLQSSVYSKPKRGNELAEVLYVWSRGSLTLDHDALGESVILTVDSDYDDNFDAVYELVQNRITYKGKQYVKVDRKPRVGDVVNVTTIIDGAGDSECGAELARVSVVDFDGDLRLDHQAHGVSAFVCTSYGDKYDAVYEPVND
ncbi:hypothetical protein [Listeria newyorkensis]|uniref:Uncharacterized protein n=1 Tax=Listeria newyorkensis TaxID=1497681 RepID=A0A841YTE5_9LIST|nr:hypothetical protein [Listeria newyorkensis]MBC1456262.1 hypothetical protein [Listeria newyorkensis]